MIGAFQCAFRVPENVKRRFKVKLRFEGSYVKVT